MEANSQMHDLQVRRSSRVGVALVNWNGGEYTIPCVHSLLAGTISPTLVVVVDNASQDGSPEQITAAFPQVVMIRNQCNEGFAGANNQAIAYLLAEGVEYIWVLNNDTTVAPDCLETLVRIAEIHPAAGFSAKIYYEAPPDRIWYAGARRHLWHCAPKHELTDAMDALAVDEVVGVDFISGCCIFAGAKLWCEQGGFVTDYVAYSEDSEWCWRVRKAGVSLFYIPKATLRHHLSASLRKNTARRKTASITPFAARLMIRNHLWTVRAHVPNRQRRWCCLVVNAGIQIRNAAISAIAGRWSLAGATVRGLQEGLLQNFPTNFPKWADNQQITIHKADPSA